MLPDPLPGDSAAPVAGPATDVARHPGPDPGPGRSVGWSGVVGSHLGRRGGQSRSAGDLAALPDVAGAQRGGDHGVGGGLNAINVFPVADSDTGTNLQQTLAGIIAHLSGEAAEDDWTTELLAPMAAPRRPREPSPADLVVRAAVLSAHGNSGAIVAEMIISLSRALERSGLIVPTEPERGWPRCSRLVAVAGRGPSRARSQGRS